MFLSSNRGLGRVRRGRKGIRGLGTTSTQVGTSLVYGSDPTSTLRRRILPLEPIVTALPVRPIGPMWPINPAWGANPPRAIIVGGGMVSAGPSPTSLAAAQALLASNPSSLTPAQWQLLQQAGSVAGTVPYSSAGQIPAGGAIDPATGQPYASELAAAQVGAAAAPAGTDIGTVLSTTYAGLPLYLWLLIGGGGFFLLSKRGR